MMGKRKTKTTNEYAAYKKNLLKKNRRDSEALTSDSEHDDNTKQHISGEGKICERKTEHV